MHGEKILDGAKLFHIVLQFRLGGSSHFVADFIHLIFHLIEKIESRCKDITYGHTFLKGGMLVKIAHADILCPFHLSLIGHQLSGDDTHKGGFSFPVCTDQTDMFPF